MSRGFPGIPGNMQGLMKQAQKMQQQIEEAQAEAEKVTAEGSAGGGMVKVVVSGKNRVLSVALNREAVNPDDAEVLGDMVMAAVNQALEKVQTDLKDRMSKITGGLNMPGLF